MKCKNANFDYSLKFPFNDGDGKGNYKVGYDYSKIYENDCIESSYITTSAFPTEYVHYPIEERQNNASSNNQKLSTEIPTTTLNDVSTVIIDFERKGNVVRFYLGSKTEKWGWTNPDYKDAAGKTPEWLKPSDTYYGDDWDDAPYEHNAGRAYDEFIKGHADIYIPFDSLVLEPCNNNDDIYNHGWCKNDMVARTIPCIIVVDKRAFPDKDEWQVNSFDYWLGCDLPYVKKYYFGDILLIAKDEYCRIKNRGK